MNKTVLVAAVAASLMTTSGAHAGAVVAELAALKNRIKQLEQAEANQLDTSIDSSEWVQGLEIRGLIEVEAGYLDPDSGDSESDVVLATAEIGISAQINSWVTAEVVFLYEEDDTDPEVDVATVSIANPEASWFVVVGQQYLPFGSYETHLVSDPLTLEIGEFRETSVLGGIEHGAFSGGIYVFNGDLAEGSDERIETCGAFAGYNAEYSDGNFTVNLGYIGDTDGLQETIQDNIDAAAVDYSDEVAAAVMDATFQTELWTVIAEYVQAIDSFNSNELAFKSGGAKPAALNLEAGFNFMLSGTKATVAMAYQQTEEAVALELPEQRLAAAISIGLLENTALSLEWAHDDDYSVSAGGSGEKGDNTLTAQIAVEF